MDCVEEEVAQYEYDCISQGLNIIGEKDKTDTF